MRKKLFGFAMLVTLAVPFGAVEPAPQALGLVAMD